MAASIDCLECGGRMHRVFSALSETRLETLNEDRAARTYQRGQVVLYEGAPALAVHCVHSGRLKLYKVGRHDDEVVVGSCNHGDLLGLEALAAHETYSATAEALETSVICAIPRDAFLALLQESPSLSLGVLDQLARRCRQAEEQLVQRTHEHVAQRAARYLLARLEDLQGEAAARVIVGIPVRREEMAQLIGTTPETLSRTLHRLALDRLIRLERSEIRILDAQGLKRLSALRG